MPKEDWRVKAQGAAPGRVATATTDPRVIGLAAAVLATAIAGGKVGLSSGAPVVAFIAGWASAWSP